MFSMKSASTQSSNKTAYVQHWSHLPVPGRKISRWGSPWASQREGHGSQNERTTATRESQERGESGSWAESAFIAPTSRLLMGRSKTGRNNPRPLRPVGMSAEGLGKATSQRGDCEPSEVDDNTLRFGALSASESAGSNPNSGSMSRSLFKLDTWPRLRGSKGDAGGSFVCEPAFENQNQIHYSGLERCPRDPPIVGRCQPGRDRATLLAG